MPRYNLCYNPRVAINTINWEFVYGAWNRITIELPVNVSYPPNTSIDACIKRSPHSSSFCQTNVIDIDPATEAFTISFYGIAGPAWLDSKVIKILLYQLSSTNVALPNTAEYNLGLWNKTNFERYYIENIAKHLDCAKIQLAFNFYSNADNVFFTGIMIEPTAILGSYADGSFTNWSWLETPHASISMGADTPPPEDPEPIQGSNSTNLINNPIFDYDLSQWSRYGFENLETSDPPNPDFYTQIILPNPTPNGIDTALSYISNIDESGVWVSCISRLVPMVVRRPKKYRTNFWIYGVGSLPAQTVVTMQFYDSDKLRVNGTSDEHVVISEKNTWNFITLESEPPPNAQYVNLSIQSPKIPDVATYITGAELGPYFGELMIDGMWG